MQELEDSSGSELYSTSLYYCLTVIVTVGYGDLKPANPYERGLQTLLMLTGVTYYIFTQGQFISLLMSYDD
jgi:Ion channel